MGYSDVHACRYRSVFYGVCFVLMGFGIDYAHAGNKALALGIAAGFLFAGPFLSTGLYELSRQRQAGESPELVLSLFAWCRNPGAIGRFAVFLSPIMLIWLWVSVPLLDTVADGFSVSAVFLFSLWLSLALLVFVASVISIPMMLDKRVSAKHAIKMSVKSCLSNWKTYGLWAMTIFFITGTSLALAYWPLIITAPVLGHASWHAYQASGCSNS
jgi:uncharacterized membrane protein